MKCEPLKNKKQKMIKDAPMSTDDISDKNAFNSGFKKGVEESFNTFYASINLFKKYKNNVKLLMNEQKDVWKEFIKYYETKSDNNTLEYLSTYNNWLFDYIFHDASGADDFLGL